MNKYRLKFEKQGYMRFIGHLDTLSLFQRCVKLAKIPIAYSQGFNPHQIMYFALPLSLGMASFGEYLDIQLSAPMEPNDIGHSLNGFLPQGIKISSGRILREKEKYAPKIVTGAIYTAQVNTTQEEITTLLEKDEILVNKKTKKGEYPANIRPLIYNLTLKDNTLNMTIAAGNNNLKPGLITNILNQNHVQFTRLDILATKEDGLTFENLWEYK